MGLRALITLFVASLMLVIVYFLATSISCARGANITANSILNKDQQEFGIGYEMLTKCSRFAPQINELPKIFGNNTYVVLLQNNWELRPTGGFMGSYAVIKFKNNILESLEVQDIYVPDGQLPGHVNPPKPILQAFGNGFWKLRDANFDPSFQKSASDTAWFFDKGGVKNFDGIIAINFSTIRKILQITGPIKLSDHDETLTSDNFYEKAQSQAQVDFFPGSKNKFNFLSEASDSLINSLKSLSLIQKVKLAKALMDEINNGEIMLWGRSEELNNIFLANHWGGELQFPSEDFIYIVESNLSSNKANCCVERNAQMKVSSGDNLSHELKIYYKNNSKDSRHVPPDNWGGDYKNFIRIILPTSAEVKSVVSGEVNLERLETEDDRPHDLVDDHYFVVTDKKSYKELSFWNIVLAKQTSEVSLVYTTDKFEGKLFIKNQPGMEEFAFNLETN